MNILCMQTSCICIDKRLDFVLFRTFLGVIISPRAALPRYLCDQSNKFALVCVCGFTH